LERRGEGGPPGEGAGESEAVLRGKYLDFCSAQVADILLRLTPDEMYVLAHEAAREAGVQGELSYDQIVALATARVSRKLQLPPLAEWVEEYRRNPSRYDQDLLGLWESEVARIPSDE